MLLKLDHFIMQFQGFAWLSIHGTHMSHYSVRITLAIPEMHVHHFPPTLILIIVYYLSTGQCRNFAIAEEKYFET